MNKYVLFCSILQMGLKSKEIQFFFLRKNEFTLEYK